MRSPEMPSRSTAWMGMPPANARLHGDADAAANGAFPQVGALKVPSIPCFAVTTHLPLARAARMISAATLVPPTSSVMTCTSGSAITWRQSVVFTTGPRPSGMFLPSKL